MKRDKSIDLIKCLLVILMITAHVMQFFCQQNKITGLLSNYINLTSFSGFLFVFGYVNYSAYFSKEDVKKSQKKLLNSAINLLLIYYLSAFSFRLLVSETLIKNGLASVFKILVFSDIPGYSEFLLSFFIINLLSFLFIKPLKKFPFKGIIYITISCLIFTLFKPEWPFLPQLALVWGSSKYSAFPVISYLPYFLIGIVFAKYQLKYNFWHLIIAAFFTLAFAIDMIVFKKAPERFPPSIFWIIGPAVFIYLYYVVSKWIYQQKWSEYLSPFEKIGTATLFYLILSNVFIFSISTQIGKTLNLTSGILLSMLILLGINMIQRIVK